ncbi:MAG TPA: type II secretion system protein [Pseudomonadota bacterium]|jgi:general secretion pathway protein I|nr:type II secretion system protein [Xanthomonadales bacterium]HQX25490.1 type II secretion system protein [Pseudomonadota bacterium]MBP6693165.1 type II secretion system protein [Xanthomonadales bacterium]MBP7418539.1 type II secretion system protein [Xanthomonadales bacterium]MBP8176888.1 type II secretion system protein [Xanthomonadales bacterium]
MSGVAGRPPRPRALPPRARGFTLIELVTSFVVFALAFGVLMEIATSSMRAARRSAAYTQAALLAQSQLDAVGIGAPLVDGRDNGRYNEDYDWELDIRKSEPPPASDGTLETGIVDLYRIELVVRWRDGPREQSASFVTLRAQQPGADQGIKGG